MTLHANNATGGNGQSLNGVGAGSGAGGAIFNYDGSVNLKHVTASNNVVGTDVSTNNPGIANGGALYNYDAAGGATPSVSIYNSILANSTFNNGTGVDVFNDATGTVNVAGAANSSLLRTSTRVTGTFLSVDPQLVLLEKSAGKLAVRVQPTSPAIDAADPANSLTTDEVGATRPTSGIDMGAVEGAFASSVNLTTGTLLIADTNADSIFAVNPNTGNRSLVSRLNYRGTGPISGRREESQSIHFKTSMS